MRDLLSRLRQPRVALVVVVVAVLAVFDALVTTPGWPYAVLLGVPVLAGSSVLDVDRRRADLLAAGALFLSAAGTAALAVVDYRYLGTWGFAETAALLVLLVTRWRLASAPRDRIAVAACASAVVAQSLRGDPVDAAVYAALLTAAATAAVAIGVALRGVDAQHRAVVAAVRRAEREEVARELHDVVAHHVTGMVVTTQAARAVLGTSPGQVPQPVADALTRIEAAGGEALASMRRMVGVLRDDPAADAPRSPVPQVADLVDLVDRFRTAGAAEEVHLIAGGGLAELPPEVQAGVYRVVQEALTNAARHARGAALVQVQITLTATGVHLRVLNTRGRGGGAAAPAGGGFGVLGMTERITALGGALVAGPHDGGWLVEATAPAGGGATDPSPSQRPRRSA